MTAPKNSSRLGKLVTISTVGEVAKAFIPPGLPPEPRVQLDKLHGPLERANRALGGLATSALRVHQMLQQKPIIDIPAAVRNIGMSAPTVAKSIQHLRDLGLLREITGKQRGRRFVYSDYLDILTQGTEPI